MKRLFTLALLCAVSVLVGQYKPAAPSIDAFFDDFTARWMRINPSSATSSRYFSGPEQDALERQITPATPAWFQTRAKLARQGLAELKAFDRSRLTDAQRLSADLMEWQLDSLLRGEKYRSVEYPLQQMNGVNVDLPNVLTVSHPLQTLKDAENYVAALGQVGTRMDEATARSKAQAAAGVLPPRFILQSTILQMQNFADSAPSQNPLVTTLDQKMATAKGITPEQRSALRAEAEKLVGTQVYPAWKRAIATLEAQLPKSTDDAGLWRFKNGAESYAHFLREYTTTSMTADQIHQIGLREVARIEKEMDTLFRQIGLTEGSVKQRSEQLRLKLQYPSPASDEARDQIIKDLAAIVRDAEKRSASLFDLRPKGPVVVQPYPRFREKNAAASYTAPAADGSRPGTFQMPLRLERMTMFGLKTLAYHETVPGHHFMTAFQVENKEVPRFRQIRAFGNISAFGEGWGLYAERLAVEAGWYEGDMEGRLGQLDGELFRARRLVVDTGIHAKHWTRQQAIDYGIEASEVERYVVMPGQACSYMVGQLKILELRDRAKQSLGAKFKLPEFHNLMITTGTVPLELLERQVDAWIKMAAARP
jgi:uncharacterized protein (DUF885 family)